MPAAKQPNPFEVWRSQQPDRAPEPVEPPQQRLTLNAAREAIREQAIDRMFDALDNGDTAAFDRASVELVDLNRRLYLEQQAEAGAIPETLDAAIAALNLATRIVNSFGQIQ